MTHSPQTLPTRPPLRGRSGRAQRTFQAFSRGAADFTGTAWAFGVAVLSLVVWAITGPLFRFSDAWQLVINTGTTIVTFLMVFLIQNAQNEDTRELHAKLDAVLEELRAGRGVSHEPELMALTPDELVEEARAGD